MQQQLQRACNSTIIAPSNNALHCTLDCTTVCMQQYSNTYVCTACSVRTSMRNHQFKCAAIEYVKCTRAIQMCALPTHLQPLFNCNKQCTALYYCPCNTNVSINQCTIYQYRTYLTMQQQCTALYHCIFPCPCMQQLHCPRICNSR